MSSNIDAIVYTSNTGHSKQFAELMGEETGVRVLPLNEALSALPHGSNIIYFGWLMAGRVKGYDKAAKRFSVRAVGAVGMASMDNQKQEIFSTNKIPIFMPLFCLQGGYEREKLHGIYRLMMDIMAKTVGKNLARKQNRSDEENEMLELMTKGGNRVSLDGLAVMLDWYKKEYSAAE